MHGVAGLERLNDTELGPGPWVSVDQARIDLFAETTGDHQWIHVDPKRAASGPFGGTIAHGFLTLSLVPVLLATIMQVDGVAMAVNYGLDKVRFPAPVPSGARVRGRCTVSLATTLPSGHSMFRFAVTVEVEGQERPGCVAEFLILYLDSE